MKVKKESARRGRATMMLVGVAMAMCATVVHGPSAAAEPMPTPELPGIGTTVITKEDIAVSSVLTRSEVLTRARSWVDVNVKYTQYDTYSNQYGTYRRDCSGFVSMAWGLSPSGMGSPTTVSLPNYGTWLSSLDDLKPGDAIDDPGSHVVLFVSWTDASHSVANVYEQTSDGGPAGPDPGAIVSRYTRSTLINDGYRPLRYNNIVDDQPPVDRTVGDVSGDGFGDLTAIDAQGHLVVYGNGLLVPAFGGRPFVGAYWQTENANWNRDARSITTADVSGDRYADYLVLTTSGHLQVFGNASLIGDGSPFLGAYVDYPNWADYTNIAAGDVNADGFADLAATRADGRLHIYLNTRETGPNAVPFRALSWDYASGWGTDVTDIALGDVSGDGYADLLGVRTDGTLTLFGNGLLLPAFGGRPFVGATWTIHGAYDQVADITVSQIDSDGYADLMLVTNGVLEIYLNNRNPTSNYTSPRWSYPNWNNVHHIA